MGASVLLGRVDPFPRFIGMRPGGLDPRAAVLGAAALAWAAGGAVPATAAPTISEVQVQPSHFSPNGDGFNDTAEIDFLPGADGDSVTVDLAVRRLADGVVVDSLLSGERRPAGVTVTQVWDPSPAADGRYRFEIRVTEGALSASQSEEVEADSTPPWVDVRFVQPNPFDPTADSTRVEVETQTSDSTTTTVLEVTNAAGLVATLGSFDGAADTSFVWDGKNEAGLAAPSGRYGLRAVARDRAQNAAADSASTVTLDRDPPELSIDQPDTVLTTAFPVILSGLAFDDHRVDSVRVSVAGQPFVAPDSLQVSASADSVLWQVVVVDAAPQAGWRDVILRAYDRVGHSVEETRTIAYDTVMPVVVSSRLDDADGTVADGDSVHVETVWNQAGFTVTANFQDLDSGYIVGRERFTDEGGGAYLVDYRVTPTNTKRHGTHRIVIRAATASGALWAADTLFVSLLDRQETRLVSIDRDRFDPLAGEKVLIAASGPTTPLRVEIFQLSGARVRVLEGSGFVEWDGRNEDGGDAASGVYFLRVQSNGSEESRKVAVLRGGGR